MSKSIYEPMVFSVWVSPEMADELLDDYGVNPTASLKWSSSSFLVQAYEWDVFENVIKRHDGTMANEDDELARILILIPTWEGRLSYLNPNGLL